MTLCHLFEACLALSVLYNLVSTSKNEGAFQESFIINLKTIKNECDANTANLLAVINDLQQNENTSLIEGLNETVQQQKQILQELKKTVEDQQYALEQQNRTLEEQGSTIHHLNTMIERLNETDVNNLKGKVENLEFGVVAQRLMI